jgi:DNA adenine methylase
MKPNCYSPFRFVGGKSRLVPTLLDYLPERPYNYYEPFCGGGSLFFAYGYKCQSKAYLSDVNRPLMNAYAQLRDRLDEVLSALTNLGDTPYNTIRAQFNEAKVHSENPFPGQSWTEEDSVNYAALFIAINHLCFNGVYRENKKGEYNVPVGRNAVGVERTLGSLSIDSLVETSSKLMHTMLLSSSFTPWPYGSLPGKGDVYIADPPYLKEFSSYNREGFNADHHILLAAQAGAIAKRGATVIVCGSNNEASHEIYGKPTRVVTLARNVGNFSESDKKRGPAEEALWIMNPVTKSS